MPPMTDDDLAMLNAWVAKYRAAYLGWANLAACVRATIARLPADPAVARRMLTEALREFSPPEDA